MKVTGTKKSATNPDKDGRQATGGKGLKSSTVTTRTTTARKEMCLGRSSMQRYAELPSLRYALSTSQWMGSGPLRVCAEASPSIKASRSTSFAGRPHSRGRFENFSPVRGHFKSPRDDAPPLVRRVHFAQLPPKLNRETGGEENGKSGERRGGGEEEEETSTRDSTGRTMRNFVTSWEASASPSHPRLERRSLPSPLPDAFALGNNGALHGGTVLANKHAAAPSSSSAAAAASRGHDTARYHHGTLTQVSARTESDWGRGHSSGHSSLLRAARDGDESELSGILLEATRFGLSPEHVNCADSSGRTALSYVASNGDLKSLELILRLPGIDVNKQDNEGNTPLHFAAQAGQVEVISYMISTCHGLDIDPRNILGFTPLMKAALQGRTKCAKLLLCAGASPVMRDSGRGLRAEQWARFCGRYVCADVIEKFSRSKVLERNGDYSRWGSEPELAARILGGKTPLSQCNPGGASTSFKSRLRKAFRSTSNPGHESSGKSYSVVSQLTSAALFASSPLLPTSPHAPGQVKSFARPLSVPKVQVTLAAVNPCREDVSAGPGVSDKATWERVIISRSAAATIKKKP